MDFDTAFQTLINPQHEGGYSIVRNDPGNWTGGSVGVGVLKGTKYGISAKAYPNLDIVNLTIPQAKAIYYPDYWLAAGCDKVPPVVAYQVFDAAVNNGVGAARRFLQRAAGVAQDGVIGPVTQAALAAANPYLLAARFEMARLDYDASLGNWDDNSQGWVRRSVANIYALT